LRVDKYLGDPRFLDSSEKFSEEKNDSKPSRRQNEIGVQNRFQGNFLGGGRGRYPRPEKSL